MTNIKYRRSIKEDIPSINNLFIEMVNTVNGRMEKSGIEAYNNLNNGYEEGYLDNFYLDDNNVIFVAEDNGQVIGFISINNYKDKGYIYLDDYSVSEKYRGKGIGSKLMNMAFEFALEQGVEEVITHVVSANKESIKFYKNKGFSFLEEQDRRLLIKKHL